MNKTKIKEIKETIEALRLCDTHQRKDDALANCAIAAEHLEKCLSLIENLTKERDAAVRDINDASPCFACRYFYRNEGECTGGQACLDDMYTAYLEDRKYDGIHFEWRGPCKDNSENTSDKGEEK